MSNHSASFFDAYNFDGYPAIKGLSHFFKPLFHNAAEGTNIVYIINFTRNLLGHDLPDVFVDYAVGFQLGVYGDFAFGSDLAPSILFAVLFGIAGFFHLLIFCINFSRGHYFWISFAWFFNCICMMIGFCLRAKWSRDVTLIVMGLVSEVFLIIPSVIFVSFDLILAQRLFTWRHPVGGSRKLFWGFMISVYLIVIILVAVTIMASCIPYLHFLSYDAWMSWRKTNMATGVIVVLYSLTALSLIALSYLFPPTKKDENLYTYQPWWIESFKPFYFVQPGAARKAEETFMKRNHNHRHATRVIAATHHHHNMVEGLSNQRGELGHNVSMLLILVTAILIFIGSLGRCIVLFQNHIQRHLTRAASPIFMYIAWGVFEFAINVMYIVGRVDLRFYRPDRLPKKVRSIITAEQSYYPSDVEDDVSSSAVGSFSSVSEKSASDVPHSPPYPRDDLLKEKDDDDDNLSDFHF